jgi:cell division initiation protein
MITGDEVLTVKDINNKRFEPVKNGYSTIDVDDFLKQCAHALKMLQTENEDMKQKLTILADNVREYQKKEADIAGAFLDIQRAKRYALEDAQTEAKKIVADAHEQAKIILGNTSSKLHSEAISYERMKKEVALFKDNVLAMYKEHLNILTAIPDEYDDLDDETVPLPQQPETAAAADDDDLPVSGLSESVSTPSESFAEPESLQNDQSDVYAQAFGAKPVPGRTDRFEGLKFGQNV